MMWIVDAIIILVCVTVIVGFVVELPKYIKRTCKKDDVISEQTAVKGE